VGVEVQNAYKNVFKQYITNRVKQSLSIVQGDRFVHSPVDQEKLLHLLDYALQECNDWPIVCKLLLTAAPLLEQAGFRKNWIPYLMKGVRKCERVGDLSAKAELILNIGIIYQLSTNYELAEEYVNQSLNGYKITQDQAGQAKAIARLAYISFRLTDYKKAQQRIQETLKLCDVNCAERATCFYLEGEIAFRAYEFTQAEHFFQKALAIRIQHKNKRLIALGFNNLGRVYIAKQKYSESIDIFVEALIILEEIGDIANQATTKMNLGISNAKLGRATEAIESYSKAEKAFRQLNDEVSLAMVYGNMAIQYRRLGNWPLAEMSSLRAVQIWQKHTDHARIINAMDELGLSYLGQKRYVEALEIFNKALGQISRIRNQKEREHLSQMLSKNKITVENLLGCNYPPPLPDTSSPAIRRTARFTISKL